MSERGPRTNRWCFTVNNPGPWRPLFQPEQMDYLCWEMEHEGVAETGQAAGTPHVQGYVRFKARKRLDAAKELINPGAHLEPAKGTEQQNKDYCSKEGHLVEHGTFDANQGAQRGRRTDLTTALDKLKAGTPRQEVFMAHPELLVKYPSGMEKAAEILIGPPPLVRDIHNTVLFGETGLGKSHRVHNAFPEAYVATVGVGTFDRYAGELTVILDEFEPTQVPIQELLQWMDKWRCQVKCRYSNRWARWNHLVIISNVEPRLWYQMEHPPQRDALRRRLDFPMGQVFEVTSIEQDINLHWMDPPPPPPPSSHIPSGLPPSHTASPASSNLPSTTIPTANIPPPSAALFSQPPQAPLPSPDLMSRASPLQPFLPLPSQVPLSNGNVSSPSPAYPILSRLCSRMSSSQTMIPSSKTLMPPPSTLPSQGLVRPLHPSPTSSPPMEPPLQRSRCSQPLPSSGAPVNQSVDMDEDVLGFDPDATLPFD